MNLRQTQRVLAEVLAKCQEIHVQLPVDPFEDMLSAGEALRHSRVGGKFNVSDAVDELRQRYGLEPKYQQLLEDQDVKRKRRQKRRRLRRADGKTVVKAEAVGHESDTESTGYKTTSSESEEERPRARKASSSRIQKIIANHPAKNPANEELADEFVELGGFELVHGRKQQGISRMAVAKQLREADQPIKSGAEARKLPHVGQSAAAKIDEILHHGKMTALEKYEAEKEEEERARAVNEDEDGQADLDHEDEDAEDEDAEDAEEGDDEGGDDDEDDISEGSLQEV